MKNLDKNYIINEYLNEFSNNIITEGEGWEKFKLKLQKFWDWFLGDDSETKRKRRMSKSYNIYDSDYDSNKHKSYLSKKSKNDVKISSFPINNLSDIFNSTDDFYYGKKGSSNKEQHAYKNSKKYYDKYVKKFPEAYKAKVMVFDNDLIVGVVMYGYNNLIQEDNIPNKYKYIVYLELYDKVYNDLLPLKELISLLIKEIKNDPEFKKNNLTHLFFYELSKSDAELLKSEGYKLVEALDKNDRVYGYALSTTQKLVNTTLQ